MVVNPSHHIWPKPRFSGRTRVWARCGHFCVFGTQENRLSTESLIAARLPLHAACAARPWVRGPAPWSRAKPVSRGLPRVAPGAPTFFPVHHRTSVSPTAPPGPRSKTTPKFTCAPTANPQGTKGFLNKICIMTMGRLEN